MSPSVDLVRKTTSRLLLSLVCLLAASAAILLVCFKAGQAVPMWVVVMASGMCGGFISIQRRLKTLTTEDLELLATSWPYIFLSPLTGGFLAGILYMLFVSGLLTGALFPVFEPGQTASKDFSRLLECTAKDYTDYAKLIFWSFVAGFSESFVTDIIGSFAKTAQTRSEE